MTHAVSLLSAAICASDKIISSRELTGVAPPLRFARNSFLFFFALSFALTAAPAFLVSHGLE